MADIGYARVSTGAQDLSLQLDALTDCVKVFTDKASGKLDERPGLTACLEYLRAGDTLVVWRLDRLGRSLPHLIETVTGLRERGIGFRSVCDGITAGADASGELIFNLFAVLAQFERRLIAERTKAGLESARARGRLGGRPAKLTADKLAVARGMYTEKGDDGKRRYTVQQIADVVGCSRSTLYSRLTEPTG